MCAVCCGGSGLVSRLQCSIIQICLGDVIVWGLPPIIIHDQECKTAHDEKGRDTEVENCDTKATS